MSISFHRRMMRRLNQRIEDIIHTLEARVDYKNSINSLRDENRHLHTTNNQLKTEIDKSQDKIIELLEALSNSYLEIKAIKNALDQAENELDNANNQLNQR